MRKVRVKDIMGGGRFVSLRWPSEVLLLCPQEPKPGATQFFMQWFAAAFKHSGGIIHKRMKLPIFICKICARTDAFLPRLSFTHKKKLLVCCGQRLESACWPYGYTHELIPIIWDAWPPYWEPMFKFLKKQKVRLAFFTSSQVAKHVHEIMPQIQTVWLPEGIEDRCYPMGDPLDQRKYDVFSYGRTVPNLEGKLRSANDEGCFKFVTGRDLSLWDLSSLTQALRQAKITVNYPRCDTKPEQAGQIETLTQRYWECMLSGTLPVGRSPQELIDLCGYNPVIPLQKHPTEKIKDILAHLSDFQELVIKNRNTAERIAPWSTRMPIIMENLFRVYEYKRDKKGIGEI